MSRRPAQILHGVVPKSFAHSACGGSTTEWLGATLRLPTFVYVYVSKLGDPFLMFVFFGVLGWLVSRVV